MSRKQERIDKEDYLYKWPIGWIIVLIVLTIFTLFAPLIFSIRPSLYDFPKDFDKIATGIGVMSPFVAICAAILTYLAFRMQFLANKKMLSDSAKLQIERQFYEMLKIHKDNVNEIKWENWGMISSVTKNSPQNYEDFHVPSQYGYRTQQGRNVFRCYLAEFDCIFNLLYAGYGGYKEYCKQNKIECVDLDEEKTFKLAYDIFFWGKDVLSKEMKKFDSSNHEYIILKQQQECVEAIFELVPKHGVLQDSTTSKDYDSLYGANIMKGHFNELNHYYRHLYQMVKCVASFDENIVSYKEKRKYLRMLRAQLTNNEQLMLFYNWKSGYGRDWESLNGNHFFTDYRMIHNIDVRESCYFLYSKKGAPEKLLVDMMKECNPSIRYEEDENGNIRTDDYLFEFEN